MEVTHRTIRPNLQHDPRYAVALPRAQRPGA